jgi:hypothetical protein
VIRRNPGLLAAPPHRRLDAALAQPDEDAPFGGAVLEGEQLLQSSISGGGTCANRCPLVRPFVLARLTRSLEERRSTSPHCNLTSSPTRSAVASSSRIGSTYFRGMQVSSARNSASVIGVGSSCWRPGSLTEACRAGFCASSAKSRIYASGVK